MSSGECPFVRQVLIQVIDEGKKGRKRVGEGLKWLSEGVKEVGVFSSVLLGYVGEKKWMCK